MPVAGALASGLGREDSRVTQVGWKAPHSERGRKSLFLGSFGPGEPFPRTAGVPV